VVALLAAFFMGHPQATAALLAEKGRARAVIIVPEKPSPAAENAARVLRDHIKQMSGVELPIRTEDRITGSPTADQAWVLVGEGKLTAKLGLTSKGLRPPHGMKSTPGPLPWGEDVCVCRRMECNRCPGRSPGYSPARILV
jgi:hypothetical protein